MTAGETEVERWHSRAESPTDLDEAQPHGVELHTGDTDLLDDFPRRMGAVEVVP